MLQDNLTEIAESLAEHPGIVYPDDYAPPSNVTEAAESTWARLSGSSVWLEEYGVYILVTRVIFHGTRSLNWPLMSFIRAQLFDENWNHLPGHEIIWQGKKLVFPQVFDVDPQYEPGGPPSGPEDPRIIIEEGVDGAEPVIVFNMLMWTDLNEEGRPLTYRSMYIFRPFSGRKSLLIPHGFGRANTEKNWSPFFHNTNPIKENGLRAPSQFINFVYTFAPLRVLNCTMDTGACDMVDYPEIPDTMKTPHTGDQNSLRGGTNFVPVPLQHTGIDEGVRAWVAVPRTHIGWDGLCGNENNEGGAPLYRPMITVIVSVGLQYFLIYASSSIDFGHAVLGEKFDGDTCVSGGILIPNSISRWDHNDGRDVMSITFSVDDSTVQAAHVTGIQTVIDSIPFLQSLRNRTVVKAGFDKAQRQLELTAVGNDVQHCAVEGAIHFAEAMDRKHKEVFLKQNLEKKGAIERKTES